MTTRGGQAWRAWPFWAAAGGFFLVVVVLLSASRAPTAGTGFDERIYAGAQCAGAAEASVVPEPFLKTNEAGEPRCVQWASHLVLRTKAHLRVELTSESGGSVTIDGRTVVSGVSDQAAHPARTRTGAVDLARGVHSFAVQHAGSAQPEATYLRVAMVDELAPHNFEFAPPLDRDAFFLNSEDASRALQSPPADDAAWSWSALVGCFALVAGSVSVWLGIRRQRGRDLNALWPEIAIASALFLAAFLVRARGIAAEDTTWDELIYVDAGAHWIRNLALGDFNAEAWRFSLTHPPNTKWLLAFGSALAGDGGRVIGGRIVSATESALAVAFLFAFGRIAFGRAVGIVAGALAVFLPVWVAHGRIGGQESSILVWWSASMLALACWLRSLDLPFDNEDAIERGDPIAAFVCVFAATMGALSKLTAALIFPVLLTVLVVRTWRPLRRGVFPIPLAAIAGGVAASVLSLAAWPYLRARPYDQLTQLGYLMGPGKPTGPIEVYLGKLTLPAWHYFLFAFVAETPALLLALALGGAVIALASRARRSFGVVTALWLAAPFLLSVTAVRIGAARYVLQAWPALLLFAAVALVALGERFARVVAAQPAWARVAVGIAPALLAIVYTARALAGVEPYPLDYFDEIVGGPSGVAAAQTFEVPWWGEGNLAAVRALNESATQGARVRLALWPKHVVARLREDLVPVDDATLADYVLVSHLQYFEPTPAGCTLAGSVKAAGAPLVDTYHCTPGNPDQLGFAEMHDPATVDKAIGHFEAALKIAPGDPAAIFGLGWAAQVKGDLAQAESRYVTAAGRAAQTGDRETEYFSRFDLGTLYRQEGKVPQAIDAFRAALVLRPGTQSIVEALAALAPAPALLKDPPLADSPLPDAGAPDAAGASALRSSAPRAAPPRR